MQLKNPYCEIITIGDEIMNGFIADTNAQWMADLLVSVGVRVATITSIPDQKLSIICALDNSSSRSNIILVTGGLGPTKDDITKNVLCEFFQTELVFDPDVFANIERLLRFRDKDVGHLNRKQAEVPKCCTVVPNPIGTAPGMCFKTAGVVYFFIPGVPFEMKQMMEKEIVPYILKNFSVDAKVIKTVLIHSVFEAQLAELLEEWETSLMLKGIRLSYLPAPGMIKLRLSAEGLNSEKLAARIDEEIEMLKSLIPGKCFGKEKDTMASVVGSLLLLENSTVGVAESCTGGEIASQFTAVPGCSVYFKGGIVAYSNDVKMKVLGVDSKDLNMYGAVSKEVVESMAIGARRILQTSYAIATSGIAGPDGGTEEKPVGTVWIAIADKNLVISRKFMFGINRERNILNASYTAINMLRKQLLGLD